MPYIAQSQRLVLDPLIAPLAQLVKEETKQNGWYYSKWLKFILFELALQTRRRLANDPITSRNPLNAFSPPSGPGVSNFLINLTSQINRLSDEIKKLAENDILSNSAGLFNYCCTQIIFLSFPGLRYWSLDAARGACTRVALALDRLFHSDDLLIDFMVNVLLNDIPDESYRRIMAEYEDDKIWENGDVTGYTQFISIDSRR